MPDSFPNAGDGPECEVCDGTGTCPECDGSGEAPDIEFDNKFDDSGNESGVGA